MDMMLPPLTGHEPTCKLTVMNSGYYGTNLNLIKKGNPNKHIWGPALWFVIEHPVHGTILFDTGYAYRYYDAVRRFPYCILKLILPVKVSENDDAVKQLKARRINPDEVSIIMSHLHIDHAGGIHDFPHAPVYLSKEEWDIAQESPLRLLKKCYLKSLFDKLSTEQVNIIDFSADVPYGPFEKSIDLFWDGTLILVPLFGHTAGQMGLIVNCSEQERYFLVADAVYCRENYLEMAYGSPLSNIAHTDVQKYHSQYRLLHDVAEANPDLRIIPSHDPKIYEELFDALPQ